MCPHTLLAVCFHSAMPHVGTHPLLGCTAQLAGHHTHSSQGQPSRNATATSLIQVHPLLELSVKSPHASLLHHHLPRAPLSSHSCQERKEESREKGRLTF